MYLPLQLRFKAFCGSINDPFQGMLTLSLPNATVVEFTVHCQTRIQSKFKFTVDICLFLTVIRDANLCFNFNMFKGHNNIVCRSKDTIFCTRMDFTKMFVMSLEFGGVKNNENMSKGKTYRMH